MFTKITTALDHMREIEQSVNGALNDRNDIFRKSFTNSLFVTDMQMTICKDGSQYFTIKWESLPQGDDGAYVSGVFEIGTRLHSPAYIQNISDQIVYRSMEQENAIKARRERDLERDQYYEVKRKKDG